MLPGLSILIQPGYSEIPAHVLWIVLLILAVLTLVLFLVSIAVRAGSRRHDKLVEQYSEEIYPLIMQYLEGELTEQEVQDGLSGKKLEYVVFEDIIFEMLEHLEGDEVQKLQQLLYLPPLFRHHLKQLNSGQNLARIKACNYFSNVRLINYRILEKLMEYLFAGNQMLAFSAASALMASKDLSLRAEALKAIARRSSISKMALLEMFYKFHFEPEDQLEEEGQELKKIVNDESIPVENLSVLIAGSSEVGYHQLAEPFLEKLRSTRDRWNHPEVLSALIGAVGTYFHMEAAPYVRRHIYHAYPKVRKAAAETLGMFGQAEDLKALYNQLYDDDFQVKLTAAEALLANGKEGRTLLERSFENNLLETKPIAESLKSQQ